MAFKYAISNTYAHATFAAANSVVEVSNSIITITAGDGLSGGGSFGLNNPDNASVTLSATSSSGGGLSSGGSGLSILTGNGLFTNTEGLQVKANTGIHVDQDGIFANGSALFPSINDTGTQTNLSLSDGNVIIDTSALTVGNDTFIGNTPLTIELDATQYVGLDIRGYNANFNYEAPELSLSKTNGSKASPTATLSGDSLAYLSFRGHDGTSTRGATYMEVQQDAAIGAGKIQSSFRFWNGDGTNYINSLDLSHTTADFKSTNITTTGALTIGADTTTIHNVNGSFIITNEIQIADGSLSDPAYAFTNQQNTGMFLNTSGNLAFAVGGTLGLNIDATTADFDNNNITTTGNITASGNIATVQAGKLYGVKTGTAGAASNDWFHLRDDDAFSDFAIVYQGSAQWQMRTENSISVGNIIATIDGSGNWDFDNNNITTTGLITTNQITETSNLLTFAGTGTPVLEINSSAASSTDAELRLDGSRTGLSTANIARISFRNLGDETAMITMRDPAANDATDHGELVFRTAKSGTLTDQMIIHHDGLVEVRNGGLKVGDVNDVDATPSTYVFQRSDSGRTIGVSAVPSGGLVCNTNVFSGGETVTIYNGTVNDVTIGANTGFTLRLAGTTSTGNRTLGIFGVATILFIDGGASGHISGAGLS